MFAPQTIARSPIILVHLGWHYGPTVQSKPFSPFSFSFSTGAHKLHFLNHFRPLTQSFSSGNHFHCFLAVHLFITHLGMHAHSHICQIQAHIFDPLQIVFTLGVWLFCVQVLDHHPSNIIPSGIYSALACSLSRCIAFTFPVTPSDISL
jgi:hypothetical protein